MAGRLGGYKAGKLEGQEAGKQNFSRSLQPYSLQASKHPGLLNIKNFFYRVHNPAGGFAVP